MAVVRFTRFTADPRHTQDLLARRADLIRTVRRAFPGLTATRLARVDEETWVDVWRWESVAYAQTAVEGAHSLPETGPAFALVRDATAEQAEIVDED